MIEKHPEHGLIKVTSFHKVTVDLIQSKIEELRRDLAEAEVDLQRALQLGGE